MGPFGDFLDSMVQLALRVHHENLCYMRKSTINPKKIIGTVSLGEFLGFLQFLLRVVSSDYGKPHCWMFNDSMIHTSKSQGLKPVDLDLCELFRCTGMSCWYLVNRLLSPLYK